MLGKTIYISKSDPRIELCGTPYFNVPASEKTLSIQTNNFPFER